MTFNRNGRVTAVATVVVAAATLAAAAAAHADPRPFSFSGVEFMPHDERLPAAKAFVADELPTGTPISTALQILGKADAWCRTPGTPGQPISCSHTSFQEHPDDMGLVDVTWTVRVTPAPDATVGTATVTRSTYGN